MRLIHRSTFRTGSQPALPASKLVQRIRKLWLPLQLILLLLALPRFVSAEIPVPALSDRIVDQTGTLSSSEIASLRDQMAAFEKQRGSQIAILVVSTTEGEVIEDFSMRVAEEWKIGRKGIDDGILITVAKEDHRMRIEVGYGLEGAIPDAMAKRIISEKMAPAFRSGDFYGGLEAAVQTIEKLIDGEELPPPEDQASYVESDDVSLGNGYFFGAAGAAFVMHWFLPTPLAVIIGAVAAWILSIIFLGFSLPNLLILFIAAILGVTWYRFRGSGGSSSSGGWSSSGGGGFSGGGGSFGGGGSSGSW